MDSTWDSEYASYGFKSQCWQLVDYVTALGKMNSMCASPNLGVKLVPDSDGEWRNNVHFQLGSLHLETASWLVCSPGS